MKFFRSEQIKEIDDFTINHEPISSIDLMERAAGQLFKWISERYGHATRIMIFTGPGNNGGDGLALGRMLINSRFNVEIHNLRFTENTSKDWEINKLRLEKENNFSLSEMTSVDQFPVIFEADILIDAIFGAGLSRPVTGLPSEIIKLINNTGATIISIDIPSGLFGEDNSENSSEGIIKADFTLSFQFPKLSFMFAENAQYIGEFDLLPIGLHREALRLTQSPYIFLQNTDILPLIKKRKKFDHKGIYGHGLLVAGSEGKMGAVVLGAQAALRTGIGLITCHIPSCGTFIVQSSVAEAMVSIDTMEKTISDAGNTDRFTAIGIGPGIGTDSQTQVALHKLLTESKKTMVIDADALNILSLNKEWLSLIPEGSVLTPHLKEFERLTGTSENSFIRLARQIEFSRTNNVVVVLKGAFTSVTTPDGKIYFNSTGNPGMATGGSGDVLTGIILSLLTQGYPAEFAAIAGVYIHGLAGDIAVEGSCCESIIASDIITCISKAFRRIREIEL